MTPYEIAQYAKGVYPPIAVDMFTWTYISPCVTAAVLINSGNVVVAFAGTHDFQDIIDDVFIVPIELPDVGWLHAGFAEGMEDASKSIIDHLEVNTGLPLRSLVVTGHSLGAAHATIFAAICGSHGMQVDHLVLLESPRPGFSNLAVAVRANCHKISSFKNARDPVVHVPVPVFGLPYQHVVSQIDLDNPADSFDIVEDHMLDNVLPGLKRWQDAQKS
jgi:surfactin synthase thioesterase subunit